MTSAVSWIDGDLAEEAKKHRQLTVAAISAFSSERAQSARQTQGAS